MSARIFALSALFALLSLSSLHGAQKPVGNEALAGLKSARVIFDVRVADQEKLLFNLKLFSETFDGLTARGIKPEMIVAFRGSGVKLLAASSLDDEARELFRRLKKNGVRFEACGVAMRIFKADPAGLIPEVTPVDNVFYSLIGYQEKGFASIAIN